MPIDILLCTHTDAVVIASAYKLIVYSLSLSKT